MLAVVLSMSRPLVAGSYTTFSQNVFWRRLDTVIWLDLPLRLLLWRVLIRSWRHTRFVRLVSTDEIETFRETICDRAAQTSSVR
ncbi:MAG: hypothetical protein U5O39_18340 [Gammaproteobacteria bacterium]|nr:hypothetical protein [Gammaproteobacteria bacterium]